MESCYIMPCGEYFSKGIYDFVKTVHLDSEGEYNMKIYTSGRYILYINDVYICEGPCRTSREKTYYDVIENVHMSKGENTIRLSVLHLTHSAELTTVYKTNTPIAIFDAECDDKHIISDGSWECYCRINHKLFYDGVPSFVPPSEDITLPVEREKIEITEKWKFDFGKGFSAPWGVIMPYEWMKRPIPMIYPGGEIVMKPIKKGDNFIEFDAGEYMTAKIYADIGKNSSVKILYSECYEFEDGTKKDRCDTNGCLKGPYDLIKTAESNYRFESYWFKAFRFIRIEAENVENAVKSLTARRVSYPLNITGNFESSDEYLNKMYSISVNTVLCCLHEIFVDCPHYEQQQYIMDASIEAAAVMCMSGDVKPVRKCLQEFATAQQPSGLLQAQYPRTVPQIIPGFSFFWIFLLKEYLDWTKDIDFVKSMTGTLDKVILFFDGVLSENGLVTGTQYWDFIDWVDGWERGMPIDDAEKESTIYSMYYATALLSATDICEKVGRKGLAAEYKEKYNVLCEKIRTHCYDAEKGLFCNVPGIKEYSVHTMIWSVLSEIAVEDEAKQQMSHIFDEGIDVASFSMTFYLFRALEKSGCYRENVFRVLKQWKVMIDNNCTSWVESNSFPRSECHGWGSAPLYELSRNILGVKVSFEDVIEIVPMLDCLAEASGTVASRFGDIKISWKHENGECVLTVNAPVGVKKILRLPSGKSIEFKENNKKITV